MRNEQAAVRFCKAAVFDDAVRFFFYDMRSGALTSAAKAMTYLGNWQSVTVLCIILLIIKPTRIRYGIPVSAGAISVTVINKIIKNLVRRERPDQIYHLIKQGGYSFPSGHSITSMFVFGMLIYLVRVNVQNRTAANVLTVIIAVPMVCIGLITNPFLPVSLFISQSGERPDRDHRSAYGLHRS